MAVFFNLLTALIYEIKSLIANHQRKQFHLYHNMYDIDEIGFEVMGIILTIFLQRIDTLKTIIYRYDLNH